MPKRGFDSESDEDPSQDEGLDSNEVLRESNDGVTIETIRMILSRESRNLRIRKDHISAILRDHGVKANVRSMEGLIDTEMKEIFGIAASFDGPNLLLQCQLPQSSKRVLREMLNHNAERDRLSRSSISRTVELTLQKRCHGTVNSRQLAKSGICLLIFCILIVNDGQIHTTLLKQILSEFGVIQRYSKTAVNSLTDFEGIVNDLIRKEYLVEQARYATEGDQGSSCLCLGHRVFREYSTQALMDIMTTVLSAEESSSQKLKNLSKQLSAREGVQS